MAYFLELELTDSSIDDLLKQNSGLKLDDEILLNYLNDII